LRVGYGWWQKERQTGVKKKPSSALCLIDVPSQNRLKLVEIDPIRVLDVSKKPFASNILPRMSYNVRGCLAQILKAD
jgi:hypothetical protein